VKKKLPIKWDSFAVDNLNSIYNYISKDSISAAKHVKKSIVLLVKTLSNYPEKYSKEEFLSEFPNNFRSITKWSYKIIYEVTEKEIIILDIFHTSQHPRKIKTIPK
jgi:plasmid stabilization system protein ParE